MTFLNFSSLFFSNWKRISIFAQKKQYKAIMNKKTLDIAYFISFCVEQ